MVKVISCIVLKYVFSIMLYYIIAQQYDFFVTHKESIKKKNHLEHEYIVEDQETFFQAISDLGQSGFFDFPKQLVIFKRISQEIEDTSVLEAVSLFIAQGHSIILFEIEKNNAYTSYIEKNNGVSFVESPVKPDASQTLTPFAFTDFFLTKDKKHAWIAFSRLITVKTDILQIQGALFWALKTLYLVKQESKDVLDIKPYVYSKMKKVESLWTIDELRLYLEKILVITKEEQFDEDILQMKYEELIFSLT